MSTISVRWRRWGASVAAVALVGGLAAGTVATASAATVTPRVDLRVLVVTTGNASDSVEAVRAGLDVEGVPYTVVDLSATGTRPTIDAAFLADTVNGVPRAKFQAVVLPNENPLGLAPIELSAINAYQTQYGIRGAYAYTWANPEVGLNYASSPNPGFVGTLDGKTATVTASGLSGPFTYLKGTVPFEDNDPAVSETYGYLATPLTTDPTKSFEPLVTMTIPGTQKQGVLAGVYRTLGRENLVMTFAQNAMQQQARVLSHGIITWLTKGVHLGYDRSYFGVHVDDVFLPNATWSSTYNCTPTEGDCRPDLEAAAAKEAPSVRMTPADVTTLRSWQTANGLKLDMVFNGFGAEDAKANNGGVDPLTNALLAAKSEFRWINHTWDHEYLGCIQDFSVIPWRCATDASGKVQWVPAATINSEISQNSTWAKNNGLPVVAGELVTGEHSGLRRAPQEPSDNPNLASVLSNRKITVIASDSSRETAPRVIGSATTAPRYPVNIFFNTATRAAAVDEYNWIYNSRLDGGSGICTDNAATSTCIAPLKGAAAYDSYIVPLQATIGLRSILNNDPRPFFVHQSNLVSVNGEQALLYPYLNKVTGTYGSIYAANRPLTQLSFTAIKDELVRQAAWKKAVQNGTISAYVIGKTVTITNTAGATQQIPLTAPEGTKSGKNAWGTAYAGERSAVFGLGAGSTTTRTLPSDVTTVTTTTTTTTTTTGQLSTQSNTLPDAILVTPTA